MTLEIAIVLAILVVSLILFISEKIRMDVVALLVLVTLAFTGLVTPTEALDTQHQVLSVKFWVSRGGTRNSGNTCRVTGSLL